jgi:hypothetical protein
MEPNGAAKNPLAMEPPGETRTTRVAGLESGAANYALRGINMPNYAAVAGLDDKAFF